MYAIHASQTVAFDYNSHQALAHLGGRRWREGLYGWVLAHVVNLRGLLHAIGKHPLG